MKIQCPECEYPAQLVSVVDIDHHLLLVVQCPECMEIMAERVPKILLRKGLNND